MLKKDHWAINVVARPMLGFEPFWSAQIVFAGVEFMHMISQGLVHRPARSAASEEDRLYGLTF